MGRGDNIKKPGDYILSCPTSAGACVDLLTEGERIIVYANNRELYVWNTYIYVVWYISDLLLFHGKDVAAALVEQFERPAAAARNAGQRIVGDHNRQAGLLHQ